MQNRTVGLKSRQYSRRSHSHYTLASVCYSRTQHVDFRKSIKIDRCRSNSILINRQISEVDKNRSQDFL